MLSILASWLLIALVFFSFGDAFVNLYNKVARRRELYTFTETFFIGLVVSCSIIGLLSLQFAANMTMAVVFAAFSILYLYIFRYESIKKNLKQFIRGLSVIDYILLFSSIAILMLFVLVPPQFSDVYIYHIQNIMWNEEYSVVPGLVNIDQHLGLNSNVFLLYSVFGMRPVVGEYVYSVNAVCLLFVLLYIVSLFRTRNVYTGLSFFILFILFIVLYRVHIGCSTDLLPNLLILFLLFVILVDPESLTQKSLLFWSLPLLCITLKLSAVFICLLTLFLFVYFFRSKAYKANMFIVISSLIIIVPWLVRNVIVSGYLIYPYPSIDIFNFEWKLPFDNVINLKEYIKAFALSIDAWNTPSKEVLERPIQEKVYRWLTEQDFMDVAVVVLGLFSILFMFIMILRKHISKNTENSNLLLVWITGVMGFLFMLIMAPAVRFGFSFIIITIAIPFYLFFLRNKDSLQGILNRFSKYSTISFFVLFICLGVFSVRFFKSVKVDSVSYISLLFTPQSIDTRAALFSVTKERQFIEDISFWVITKEACYNTPLPCVNGPEVMNEIEVRGKTLQEGFRPKR